MSAAVAMALLAAALLVVSPAPGRRLWSGAPNWIGKTYRRETFGVCVVGAGAVVVVLFTPLVAAAAAAAVSMIAVRRRRAARQRFTRGEGDAVASALEVLVGELSVGAHPVQAFAVAAQESRGAVGRSLGAVAGRARLGADVVTGLRSMAAESSVPTYWERIAGCWQLAADQGLAMSVLMRTAHRDILERQRFADRVHAGSAGARATASILAGLPFLGVLLGQLVGADPLRFLLGGGVGSVLLMAGVALIGLGVTWSDRIVDRAAP